MSERKTILIEKMHGFDHAASRLRVYGYNFVYADLNLLRQHNNPVRGIVKGPRGMFTRQQLVELATTHPGVVISYIGRHIDKVVPSDISIRHRSNRAGEITLGGKKLAIVALEHSPLSTAVADYIFGVTNAILENNTRSFRRLTIDHGNTFSVRRGHRFSHTYPKGVSKMNVVVLGAGDIGSTVIDRFARAGSHVVYSSRLPKRFKKNVTFDPSINHVVATEAIDILTNHLPSSVYIPLERVKHAGLFIHTGSGNNINETELLRAMEEGRIEKAVVDVFARETNRGSMEEAGVKQRTEALIKQGRLFLTPHIAYLEQSAIRQTLKQAVKNIMNYKGGSL